MYYFIPAIVLLLAACDAGDGTGIVGGNQSSAQNTAADTENHHNGSFAYSSVADGVWPPQPVGVTNTQAFNAESTSNSIRVIKTANARHIALQNERLITAIGNRYRILGSYETENKNSSISITEVEIFNYDSNELITATIQGNNVTVATAPASDYQPAETNEEIEQAVSLAAAALQQQGFDTTALNGTALLQHPTAAEVAASGKQFYEHRILYVTFGQGNGYTPVFRASVDLSDERVLSSGLL